MFCILILEKQGGTEPTLVYDSFAVEFCNPGDVLKLRFFRKYFSPRVRSQKDGIFGMTFKNRARILDWSWGIDIT